MSALFLFDWQAVLTSAAALLIDDVDHEARQVILG